jgi:hypothetical protein
MTFLVVLILTLEQKLNPTQLELVSPKTIASCDWGTPDVGDVVGDKLVENNGEAKMGVVVSMCELLEQMPMDRKVKMGFYVWGYRSIPSILYEIAVFVLVCCEEMASHGHHFGAADVSEECEWVVVEKSWIGVCSLQNT